jgi:hypothetical protein
MEALIRPHLGQRRPRTPETRPYTIPCLATTAGHGAPQAELATQFLYQVDVSVGRDPEYSSGIPGLCISGRFRAFCYGKQNRSSLPSSVVEDGWFIGKRPFHRSQSLGIKRVCGMGSSIQPWAFSSRSTGRQAGLISIQTNWPPGLRSAIRVGRGIAAIRSRLATAKAWKAPRFGVPRHRRDRLSSPQTRVLHAMSHRLSHDRRQQSHRTDTRSPGTVRAAKHHFWYAEEQ